MKARIELLIPEARTTNYTVMAWIVGILQAARDGQVKCDHAIRLGPTVWIKEENLAVLFHPMGHHDGITSVECSYALQELTYMGVTRAAKTVTPTGEVIQVQLGDTPWSDIVDQINARGE